MKGTFGYTAATGRRRLLATVGAIVAVAAAGSAWTTGPARGGTPKGGRIAEPWTVSRSCGRTQALHAGCGIVIDFFRSANSGQYARACSLLGAQLLADTRGADCPHALALGGPRRYGILGVRQTARGVGVVVSADLQELDHFRRLRWLAIVGREAGQLKILETRRWG